MTHNSPFDAAPVRRFMRRREEAELAIEIAFAVLEGKRVTPDQLGDLADALDALRQQQYYVSVMLAQGSGHSAPRYTDGRRPEAMTRTIDEMAAEFSELRARSSAV